MKPMITVFGANGKIGRIVTTDALNRGYTVKAFVHSHNNFDEHPNLIVIEGDIYDPATVQSAVESSSAVISALGSWGTKNKDILTTAMMHIIPAMRQAGVSRIVTLTGADARASGDDLSLVHRLSHFAISLFAGKILHDGEHHIALLEKSGLDWTVVRSPIMTSSKSAVYSLSSRRPNPWQTISRNAVANALLNQLDDNSHHSQDAPFIS